MVSWGLAAAEPCDVWSGENILATQEGTEFWMCKFQEWASQCGRLVLHFAPLGQSFVSTKDRSLRAQIRSASNPEGLRSSSEVLAANHAQHPIKYSAHVSLGLQLLGKPCT